MWCSGRVEENVVQVTDIIVLCVLLYIYNSIIYALYSKENKLDISCLYQIVLKSNVKT